MKIGYARVSTEDQNLRLQQEALQKAGCQKIYQEKVSGAQVKRRALEELLNNIRPGDRLVVCKLDRLGRSLKELVKIIEVLQEKQIAFESIQQSINTRTALGRYFFHTFCTLAQFERDLIRERTLGGLAAARAAGRLGGRPPGLTK